MEYAGQSFRLMALAVGTLKHASHADVTNMSLPDAERWAGPMHVLGLLVLSNHVHASSKETISQLQNK